VRAEEPAKPAEELVAAPAPDPNAVVARVGDVDVTEKDIAFAGEAFADELANVPDAQRRGVTIDAVVNMRLLARAALDAGLDKTEDFATQLEFMRLQTLRNLYVSEVVSPGVTEADMQEGYQTLVVGQHKPEEQVHARHILVETKETAEKIIQELKDGKAFEELAKQSKDPSGQSGGDLGFFGRGQMVKPFEDAAFALEVGGITQAPVESQFGWHVIKVEEKRTTEPPAFADVEPQLRDYLLRQEFRTVIAALRDKYPVEIVGAPAAPATPATPAAPETPAEEPAAGQPKQN
jgi:peptidyl-prolyl cis-trans isomerase C